MERDLLKRFLGIIAEMLSLRMGAPSRLEVVLLASVSAGAGAAAGHGSGAGSGTMAGGPFGPGDDPFRASGASGAAALPSGDFSPTGYRSAEPEQNAGSASAAAPDPARGPPRSAQQGTRHVPSAFNEKPQDRGSAAPGSPVAGKPASGTNLTPAEREAIKLVERLFKGTLAGFAAAGAVPASAGGGSGLGAKALSGGRSGSADSDDRAAVYEPERYDGETFEA